MKRTKLLLILGILALTAVVFTGCKEADSTPKVTGVEIRIDGVKAGALNMKNPGDTGSPYKEQQQLTAKILPAKASSKVTWSKTDDASNAIIHLTSGGLVTSVGPGEAHVEVTTVSGKKKAGIHIKVYPTGEMEVLVTGVTIMTGGTAIGATRTLTVGSTLPLTADVEPGNATFQEVLWDSSNKNAATVSDDGLVTALNVGTTTISVKTAGHKADNNPATASFSLTVNAGGGILVNSVVMSDKLVITPYPGDQIMLSTFITPTNAAIKTLAWSSGTPSVASVNPTSGVVTPLSIGTTIITASSTDGSEKSDTATVHVTRSSPDTTTTTHWKFQDAIPGWAVYDGTDAASQSATTNGTNAVYYNGMTLTGGTRSTRWLPSQSAIDGATIGCIQPNGAGRFAVIAGVQGPFTITAIYSGTSNSNNFPERKLQINTGVSATGSGGSVAITGEGQNFTDPKTVKYDFKGSTVTNVGLEAVSGALRIYDVIIEPYSTPLDTVLLSEASNKTIIMAGDTVNSAAPESLQFSASFNDVDITNTATWSISDSSTFNAGTSVAGFASISSSGLLTAESDIAADKDVWVFASYNSKPSTGFRIMIRKWADVKKDPVVYNFSDNVFSEMPTDQNTDSTSAFVLADGFTVGSGVRRTSQGSTAAQNGTGYSFSYMISTRGSATTSARYIEVPLNGPANVTVLGHSNNSTPITLNVTAGAASTATLGSFTLPGWASNGAGMAVVTYTSTTVGSHKIALKPSGSARLFLVKVEYN